MLLTSAPDGKRCADAYEMRSLLPVVDCLQLDATRCGGYTGWLAGAALARAHNMQVSAHCAPALHAPVAAAVANLRHVEWFVGHAMRICQRAEDYRIAQLADSSDRAADTGQWITSRGCPLDLVGVLVLRPHRRMPAVRTRVRCVGLPASR
jgi:hypothetical protein